MKLFSVALIAIMSFSSFAYDDAMSRVTYFLNYSWLSATVTCSNPLEQSRYDQMIENINHEVANAKMHEAKNIIESNVDRDCRVSVYYKY